MLPSTRPFKICWRKVSIAQGIPFELTKRRNGAQQARNNNDVFGKHIRENCRACKTPARRPGFAPYSCTMNGHRALPHHVEVEPPAELRDAVRCLWYDRLDGGDMPADFTILPDGYAEIVFHTGSLCTAQ